ARSRRRARAPSARRPRPWRPAGGRDPLRPRAAGRGCCRSWWRAESCHAPFTVGKRRGTDILAFSSAMVTRAPFVVAGLFAGVGGIELGLRRAGHEAALLCEFDPGASAVLEQRFRGVRLHGDVRTLAALPREVDLLAAGFPCQDLSQAGQT